MAFLINVEVHIGCELARRGAIVYVSLSSVQEVGIKYCEYSVDFQNITLSILNIKRDQSAYNMLICKRYLSMPCVGVINPHKHTLLVCCLSSVNEEKIQMRRRFKIFCFQMKVN